MPLLDADGKVMGHVAVVDVRPMPADKKLLTLFEIFANAPSPRCGGSARDELRERQEKLSA